MVPLPAIADFCLLGAGWLEGLGPLLLVVFWVVRQVMTAVQDQKEKEHEKAKRDPAQREGQQLDDEPAWGDRDRNRDRDFDVEQAEAAPPKDLRSEVTDFLKRLDKTLEGDAEAFEKPDPEPRPAKRGPIDPFEEPPRRQQRPTPPTPVELVLEDEELLAPSQSSEPRRRSELRHLPESQLAENAAHMGEQIGQTDERLEARLHDKFDHRLGNLRRRQDESTRATDEPPAPSSASRIRKLLTTPSGVRDAIILSEILQRPRD